MAEVVEEVDPGELKEAPLPSRSAVVRGLVVFVMFCAVVPSVLGLLGRWGWVLDLCNHFRFQCALVLAVTTVGLLVIRSWRMAAISLGALALNLAFVLSLYLGSPGAVDTSKPTMTVMQFNVHTGNKDRKGVIAEIESHAPDLLFVQEVNQSWMNDLNAGLSDYEIVVSSPRADNFGIACYKRKANADRPTLSILSSRSYDITRGIAQVPVIEVKLTLDGQAINVLSIHPLPPMSQPYARARNATLGGAGQWSADQTVPNVVTGDFNATPWSTAFRDLQSAGGLVNSQVGFGQAPTWPAAFNTLGMIPIDHLLHSKELVTVDRVVGEANGSDHKPLIVELGWKK
jgi:endonuclease/exonuclease/phosphatase (EEP) superfamily protein YafD